MVDRGSRARIAAELAEQFREQEWVTAGRLCTHSAQLVAGVVSETVPDQAGDGGLPERPGPKYGRAGLEHQRFQVLAVPIGVRSHCQRDHDGQAGEPVR